MSGNTQPQPPQLAEPLWTDPGIKSGIGVHELISTQKKKKKKGQAGNKLSNIFPKFSHARKRPPSPSAEHGQGPNELDVSQLMTFVDGQVAIL